MKFRAALVFLTVVYSVQCHITLTPLLQDILCDMKLYTLDSKGDPYLHAGDLYEHSVWTHNAMVELLRLDNYYITPTRFNR